MMHLPPYTQRRLRTLLTRDPLDLSVTSGIAAFLWGVWVLYPSTTFTTPSFETMGHWAPEWAWGLGVMSVGISQIAFSLFSTGLTTRIGINGLSFLMWFFIALAFGLSNIASTGVPIYSLLALVALGSYVRRVTTRERDET